MPQGQTSGVASASDDLTTSTSTSLDIPETAINSSNERTSVTTVAENGFASDSESGKTYAYEILNLAPTILDIQNNAFKNNDNLLEVNFGNNSVLNSIGESAFEGCTGLEKVELPSTVTSIGNRAFANDGNIETLEFESDSRLSSIGDEAFAENHKLEEVNLPESCETVGHGAFKGCESLSTVTINNQTIADLPENDDNTKTFIYDYASVVYLRADLVESLTEGSFLNQHFEKNESGEAPEGYVRYERNESAQYLTFETIKGSLNCMVKFKNGEQCPESKNIVIPKTVKINDTRYTVTQIAINGFDGEDSQKAACKEIKSITLPDSITCISANAFHSNIALTSINIPNNVGKIEMGAFNNCTNANLQVTFGRTTGWQVIDSQSETIPISSTDLANSRTAATYLTNNYVNYEWENTETPKELTYTYNKIGETNTCSISKVKNEESMYTGDITLPSASPDGMTVVAISGSGFTDCTSLTSVTIPETITNIEPFSFKNCTSLGSVYINYHEWVTSDDSSSIDVGTASTNATNLRNVDEETGTREHKNWGFTGIKAEEESSRVQLEYQAGEQGNKGYFYTDDLKFIEIGVEKELCADFTSHSGADAINAMVFLDEEGNQLNIEDYIIIDSSTPGSFIERESSQDLKSYFNSENTVYYFGDAEVESKPTSYNADKIVVHLKFKTPEAGKKDISKIVFKEI